MLQHVNDHQLNNWSILTVYGPGVLSLVTLTGLWLHQGTPYMMGSS